MTFNLESEEFLSSFKTGQGLKVLLHENNTRAFMSTEGYAISAGTETNIAIKLVSGIFFNSKPI